MIKTYIGEFQLIDFDSKNRVYRAQRVELLEAAKDAVAFLDAQDEQINALVAAAEAHSW